MGVKVQSIASQLGEYESDYFKYLNKEGQISHVQNLAKETIKKLNLPYLDQSNALEKDAVNYPTTWIERFSVLEPGKLLQKIVASLFGVFIAKAHPKANEDTLRIVSDFATWLFIYDDRIEKNDDLKTARALHTRTIEILKGCGVKEGDSEIVKGLNDIVERINKIGPPQLWKDRFIHNVESYCRATEWETQNRLDQRIPTLEEYKKMRPKFSGTKVMFDLIELVESTWISTDVFVTEFFKELRSIAADLVNWENDILSAANEFDKEDVHNLVFVLIRERKCSFAEAFAVATEMFNSKLARFEAIMKNLIVYKKEVQVYTRGIFDWLSGHHFWAKHTVRYHTMFE